MKKRVLIYALKMTVGGVEKALLGMLSQFPEDEYEVTLVLQQKTGDFLAFIPESIKVLEHEEWKKVRLLVENPLHVNALIALKQGKILQAFYLLWLYLMTKLQKSYYPLHKYVQTLLSDLPGDFDLAIDYAGPTCFTACFVAKHIHAKEKWTWIHYDIERFGIDSKVVEKVYSAFKQINIVSQEGKEHFDRNFPQFAFRTRVFYNIINKGLIERQADLVSNPYNSIKEKIKICTVGRFSKEKGQILTIHSLKILIDKGYDVHWCYIGTGACLTQCKDLAKEYGILDHITFAGAQINPYPWMKHCNIYVQPSIHEGFCITLAEAKIFNVPIVSTSFTGAKEQLREYLCPNVVVDCDSMQIADGIEKIILNEYTL
jgi:glycosyltransferase involved in cell wall biosynthesis